MPSTLKATLAAVVGGVCLGGCSLFGIRSGTEESHYTVIAHQGAIEIRQYGARVAATTTVPVAGEAARSEGFQILAAYIFGRNRGQRSIAMTAPVAQGTAARASAGDETHGQVLAMTAPVAQQAAATGGSTISFFMPAGLTLAELPQPDDPRVVLTPVPPATYAVLRFTGDRSSERVAQQAQQLFAGLAGSPWHADGAATAWFYDPPWTIPFLRRNEVAVPVRSAG
jgi:hypothetical protein